MSQRSMPFLFLLIFLIFIDVATLLYLKSFLKRLQLLKSIGREAAGESTACKPYKSKAGRRLSIRYLFRIPAGETIAGKCDTAYSNETERQFSDNRKVSILYLPDKVNFSSIKDMPDTRIQAMEKFVRILPAMFYCHCSCSQV